MMTAKRKLRLDQLMLLKGMTESREAARAEIMVGNVLVNERLVTKPGSQVDEEAELKLLAERRRFVSRGGYKLEKALQVFPVDVAGRTILDAGASTGGFTDCLLQAGAQCVYSVDVGYGQLAWKLRNDPRVKVMERKNVRYLAPADIPERVDAVTGDLSFISLAKVLPALVSVARSDAFFILLVKPQFEVGPSDVGKRGVVRSAAAHIRAVEGVIAAAAALTLSLEGLTYSPLKGPEGNIEYLILLYGPERETGGTSISVEDVVAEAFLAMK